MLPHLMRGAFLKLALIILLASIAVLFEIVIPFILALLIVKRFEVSWKYFGFGALVFVLVQIPHFGLLAGLTALFNRLVPPNALSSAAQVAINAVVLGLLAGLFEEFGRYFVFKYWLEEVRSFKPALMFGAGWGGIESISVGIAVAISVYSLFMLSNLNPAKLPQKTVASLNAQQKSQLAEQVKLAKDQLKKMHSYEFLVGLLERIFAIILQLAFTLIVVQAFIKNRFFYVWLAVIYHAFVDGLGVVFAKNIFVAELIVGVFALSALAVIVSLSKDQEVPSQASQV